MAKLFAELLVAMLGVLVRGWVYALWLKVAAWLDTRVHGRVAKIVVGLLLGLVLFFLLPIATGLVSL